MTATTTHITGIRTVSIPVGDQDAALRFYSGTLGFTVLRDNPTPNGGRWIELAPGVDVDEILRWPDVPAMFAFRDPDGNAFSITETA